jgi:hypothetical protein
VKALIATVLMTFGLGAFGLLMWIISQPWAEDVVGLCVLLIALAVLWRGCYRLVSYLTRLIF